MITSGFSLAFNNKALLNNSNEMLWQRNIYQVTTSTDSHGTMTASPMSGFSGTNVTLSNTPNANYGFSGYSITGATLTGNQFTLNNDVTAKAGFSAEPIKTKLLGYIGNNFPMPKVEYRWSTYTSTININCCFDLSGNLRNGLYTNLYFLPVTWDNVRTPQTLYNHRTDYHSYTADYDPTFGTEGVNRYSIKGDVVVTSFLLSGTQAGGVNAHNTGMIIQAKGGDLTFPITHEGAGGFIVSAENPNGVFTAASGKVGIVITASNVSQYYPTARFFTDQTGYSNNASFGGYVIL